MQTSTTAGFVASLPVLEKFSSALPKENYQPIPDDWLVAVSDVVQSRKAISEGHYKSVNMAGVSMISAIMNAVGHQDIPYIFGGDGAAVAVAPEYEGVTREALAATRVWVSEALSLELRAALVPVAAIRAAGLELLVAAVRVSPAIRNFAFLGGGIGWAEKAMKEGEYEIAKAPLGTMPDLTGLSCRWTPIGDNHRKIVSLIVEPAFDADELDEAIVERIMGLVRADAVDASPMPSKGPGFTWPPKGLEQEAKASGMSKGLLYAITFLAWILDKTGVPLGKFDPKRYREFTALNTDYRKIQDGIRMTLSMNDDELTQLRQMLEAYRQAGELRFGICEQESAVLTCFVPSIMEDDHFHFLDGAGGGYAAAADDLK